MRPGAKAPALVAELLSELFMVSPSPDRKWLAIGWTEKRGLATGAELPPYTAECHLLLLDAGGKVFARLDGAK